MQVTHSPDEHRFVVPLEDGTAVLHYRMLSAQVMNITQTYVPPSARGRGIGGVLVEAALDYAKAQAMRVIPTCWYVETWVERHPDYRALIVDR